MTGWLNDEYNSFPVDADDANYRYYKPRFFLLITSGRAMGRVYRIERTEHATPRDKLHLDCSLYGDTAVGTSTVSTLDVAGTPWAVDEFEDMYVMITGGTGSGQRRKITGNDDHILSVTPDFGTVPDATSGFLIRPGFDLTDQHVNPGDSFVIIGMRHGAYDDHPSLPDVTVKRGGDRTPYPTIPCGDYTCPDLAAAGIIYTWFGMAALPNDPDRQTVADPSNVQYSLACIFSDFHSAGEVTRVDVLVFRNYNHHRVPGLNDRAVGQLTGYLRRQ